MTAYFILGCCTIIFLASIWALYRTERLHDRARLWSVEHKLNDALALNYALEHRSRHWEQVAAECRAMRIRLVEELSEARKQQRGKC